MKASKVIMPVFRWDEQPGLKEDMTRQSWLGMIAASFLIFGFGYLIYFGVISIERDSVFPALLRPCGLCEARYRDLRLYDGVSGDVYAAVLPAILVIVILQTWFLTVAYLRARRRSGNYIPMKRGAGKQALTSAAVTAIMVFALVLLPTDLSTTRYPGSMALLAGSTFPVLAAVSAATTPILAMPMIVFCFKKFGL